MAKSCRFGGETLDNGNCANPDPVDGLPVQCVGEWSEDKHYYLRQYVGATRSVRAAFLPPTGNGGAAFIDLFAGPGRARLRDTGKLADGSPLIALSHADAPFTKVVLCDIDDANLAALEERTRSHSERRTIVPGDCNAEIAKVVEAIPKQGLNIALVDPYALHALKFATLAALAGFKRMDLIIHFPTADLKRNLFQYESTAVWLDEALGTASWRATVRSVEDVARLIEILKDQLGLLGYGSKDVRSIPIKNTQNLTLYHLVYASKKPLGDAIWQSIAKNAPTGQRGFGGAGF